MVAGMPLLQVYIDRQLNNRQIYPPINVLPSLSRLMVRSRSRPFCIPPGIMSHHFLSICRCGLQSRPTTEHSQLPRRGQSPHHVRHNHHTALRLASRTITTADCSGVIHACIWMQSLRRMGRTRRSRPLGRA